MIFEKLFNCIDKKKIATITVLLPGSFKPMHGGHINLIRRYAEHPYVDRLKVLIGPGTRNGITQEIAYEVATLLLQNFDNVDIEMVKENSPVLTCYKYMETARPGIYALAGTNKGEDYKRVIKFVNDFRLTGKYRRTLLMGVSVTELNVKIDPLLYLSRSDHHDKKPVSGTILRGDLLNNDKNQFKTNYPTIDKYIVDKIWNIVIPSIKA